MPEKPEQKEPGYVLMVFGAAHTSFVEKVNKYVALGYQPLGQPFRTGNRIVLNGDPTFPRTTNELAQAMVLAPKVDPRYAVVRCSDCVYWQRYECHRHCPKAVEESGDELLSGSGKHVTGHWPTTANVDGCAEGIRKESA